MANFSYGGTVYPFVGNSGCFLCSTSTLGGGTQSNGVLLTYRAAKTLSYYRDAIVWLPLGRSGPVTELGSYSYRTMQVQASYPGTGTDYNGATVTRDVIESRITAIISNLQLGQFLQYQDSRGRVLNGTFAVDPVLEDQSVLWTNVHFTVCEISAT